MNDPMLVRPSVGFLESDSNRTVSYVYNGWRQRLPHMESGHWRTAGTDVGRYRVLEYKIDGETLLLPFDTKKEEFLDWFSLHRTTGYKNIHNGYCSDERFYFSPQGVDILVSVKWDGTDFRVDLDNQIDVNRPVKNQQFFHPAIAASGEMAYGRGDDLILTNGPGVNVTMNLGVHYGQYWHGVYDGRTVVFSTILTDEHQKQTSGPICVFDGQRFTKIANVATNTKPFYCQSRPISDGNGVVWHEGDEDIPTRLMYTEIS